MSSSVVVARAISASGCTISVSGGRRGSGCSGPIRTASGKGATIVGRQVRTTQKSIVRLGVAGRGARLVPRAKIHLEADERM